MILKARGVRRLRPIDIRRAKNALLRKSAVLMVAMAMIVVALGMTAMALRAPETRSDVIVEANAPERKVLAAVLGADYSCALMSNGKTECCKNTACGWVSQKNEDDRGACRPQNKIKEDEDMINRCSEPNVDGGLDASTQTSSLFGDYDKLCNKVAEDQSCEDCTDLSDIINGAPIELALLRDQMTTDTTGDKGLKSSLVQGKPGKDRFLCYANDGLPSRNKFGASITVKNVYAKIPFTKTKKLSLKWQKSSCKKDGDIEHCNIPFQTLLNRVDFDNFDLQQDAETVVKSSKADLGGTEMMHFKANGVEMTLYDGTPEFRKLKKRAADQKYNEQQYVSWPKRALWKSTHPRLQDALLELKLTQPKPDTKVHVTWTSGVDAKTDVIKTALDNYNKPGDKIKILKPADWDKISFTKEFWGGKDGYGPFEDGREAWYPNFADSKLIYMGKSWLLGQDETIAFEHPLLIGFREWLIMQNRRNCPFRSEGWNQDLPKAPPTSVLPEQIPVPNFGQSYCRQYLGKGSMVIKNLPFLFRILGAYPKINTTTGQLRAKPVSVYGDNKALLEYCGERKDKVSNKYKHVTFDEWNKKEGDDKFDFLGERALVGTSQPAKEEDLWASRSNMYIAAHPINYGGFMSVEKLASRKDEKKENDRLDLLNRKKTFICNELEEEKQGEPRQCKSGTCASTRQLKSFAIADYAQIVKAYTGTKEEPNWKGKLTMEGAGSKLRYLCYDEPDSERMLYYNPDGMRLKYSVTQIKQTFSVILNTFRMIKESSGNPGNIELHIGNLGGGIFANNMFLVSMLQFTAAKSVGIERIVYHDGSKFEKTKDGTNIPFLNKALLQDAFKAFKDCYQNDEYTFGEFFDNNLVKCLADQVLFEVGTKFSK